MHVTAIPLVVVLLSQAPTTPMNQPVSSPAPSSAPADQLQDPLPASRDIGDPGTLPPVTAAPLADQSTRFGTPQYTGAEYQSSLNDTLPQGPYIDRIGNPLSAPSELPRDTSAIRQVQNLGPNGVAPAQPIASGYQTAQLPRAVSVMNYLMRPPSTGKGLTGTPASLVDMLDRTNIGSARQTIRNYWRLRELTGLYHSALREVEYLKLADTQNVVDQERLEQAHLEAVQRAEQHRRDAVNVQRQLQQMLGRSGRDELPIASDHGVTGEYRTRYESMRAQGLVGSQARTLHEELPVALVYLSAVTELAGDEDHALGTMAQQFNVRGDTSALLMKMQVVRAHNRAYFRALRAYNQLIGDYVTSISIPNRSSKMLAEMLLVPSSQHTELARVRSHIRQQSAEIADNANNGDIIRQAFREVPAGQSAVPR